MMDGGIARMPQEIMLYQYLDLEKHKPQTTATLAAIAVNPPIITPTT